MHFLRKKLIKVLCAVSMATALAYTSAFGLYLATITGSGVNFRASADGNIIGSLSKGTKVAVIDNSSDWYRIAANGVTGYISGQYICGTADGDASLGKAVITCGNGVNVRAESNTESAILDTIANNTTVSVLGIYNDFYKVKYGETTGYIYYPYVYINGQASSMTSRDASSSAGALRQQVLNYAASFLGTPYVYGGSSPSGFDCSGFTSYVYRNTVRSIPRTSSSQYSGLTRVSSMSDLLPADLVFFGSGSSVSHVGIYVGDGKFIHSPHTGSSVKYDTLWSGNYKNRFVGAARVIFD